MSTTRTGLLDVEKVLEELHKKKNWLDIVITALEAESEAPDSPLVVAAKMAFEDGHIPRVDLSSESQLLLIHLAKQVRRSARGAREVREDTASRVA